MADLEGFDADAQEAHVPFDFKPVPNGEYEVVIQESEMKDTKNGSALKLKMQIISGEYAKRVVFDNLNIDNPSEKCVQIARGKLAAIAKAVKVTKPKRSEELHNKPFIAVVGTKRREDTGELQNEVRGYKPKTGQPPAQRPTQPPQTPQQRPTQAPPPKVAGATNAPYWRGNKGAAPAPAIEVQPEPVADEIPF